MLKMEMGGPKPERKASLEEEALKNAEIRARELSLKYGLPVTIEGTDWVAINGNLCPAITVTANGIGEPLVKPPGKQLPENIFD